MEKLQANAGALIIAGSETTATLLSGVTYLLLKNPAALEKLTEEVRSTFKSEDEISINSVGHLKYMLACLDEALRIYPPTPSGLPRVVPQGGVNIVGNFVPENVSPAVELWQPQVPEPTDVPFDRPLLRYTCGPHTTTRPTLRSPSSSIPSATSVIRASRLTSLRCFNLSMLAHALAWAGSKCPLVCLGPSVDAFANHIA